MQMFDPFHRKHGVYRREELTSPNFDSTKKVELPVGPVIHYLPTDVRVWGPDETYWLLRHADGPIWVNHVMELSREFGNPRRVPGDINSAIRAFHRKHPALQRVLNAKSQFNDVKSVVVWNYAMVSHFWKYQNNMFTEFHRNMNFRDTVWKNVAETIMGNERHHWIPLQMPTDFPTLDQIRKAEGQLDREGIKRFTSLARIFFLDVWKWMGDEEARKSSPISQIPEEAWGRVNLIFMLRDRWYQFNLGHVDQFRKRDLPVATALNAMSKEEQKAAQEMNRRPYDSLSMQKRFLRGLIALIESGVSSDQQIDELGSDTKKESADAPNSNASPAIREMEEDDPFGDPFSQAAEKAKSNKGLPSSSSIQSNRDSFVGTTPLPDSPASESRFKPETSKKQQEARAELLEQTGDAVREVKAELSDEQIEKDLDALNEVEQLQQEADYQIMINPNRDPMEAGIMDRANELAKAGMISGPQYKSLQKLSTAYKDIKNPWGDGKLVDAAKVTAEELKVEPELLDVKGPIFDDSMRYTTLNQATAKYVKETLKKDIANSVLSAQRAGVAVTDFRVDRIDNAAGSEDIYSVRFAPVNGVATTWRFPVPVIREEGTFRAGNTEYHQFWQRRDVPIRKVGPTRVSLTSYYGKIAVSLSERQVNNYGRWLADAIAGVGVDGNNSRIKDLVLSNVFYSDIKVPKVYSMLSRRIKSMQLDDMLLYFDYADRKQLFADEVLAKLEAEGGVVAGQTKDGRTILIDKDGGFNILGKKVTDQPEKRGQIEDIIGVERAKAPIEIAMVKVLGQQIPVGVALSYYYGLSNVIRMIGATTRRVLIGDRMNLEPHEIPIRFSDETLVISSREPMACLLLGGYRFYHQQIRQQSIYSFDSKPAFVSLLDGASRNAKHTSELDMLNDMFVDPMTMETLQGMKEPTEWIPLLVRATELLLTDYSPDETDGEQMVYKGYERLAGTVYNEMVKGIRQFRHSNRISKSGIDIKPTAVWQAYTGDAAVRIVDDSNPMMELRGKEGVTYIGNGGRSKRSMVASTRRFHKNDEGTIGEGTVDSGDVGINVYFSANPQLTSTRGTTRRGSAKTTGISSMVSTSAMISPAADRDDPKRVNFIGIQHGSGIAAEGYKVMPFRTGYEGVLAYRTGKKFSYVAKGTGSIVSIKGGVLKVKYENGAVDGVQVGRIFTKGAGHTYPNMLVATVQPGDVVTKGDVLVYNSMFFKPDYFNPRSVTYKAGVPARVALLEATGTLEDSSVISENLSAQMKSYETEVRAITLDFSTVLRNLVKVGDHVEADSILCTLEDQASAAAELFGENAGKSLELLTDNAPKAKVAGVVEKIEVFYNGDLEDMSESLRALAEANDAQLAKLSRDLGEKVESGRTENVRVNSSPIALDTLVIYVSITHGRAAFAGDKGVFANQMKSVFGRVMTGVQETESGLPLDAIFSDKSIEDRIVLSARIGGMANALLIRIGQNVVAAYRGK